MMSVQLPVHEGARPRRPGAVSQSADCGISSVPAECALSPGAPGHGPLWRRRLAPFPYCQASASVRVSVHGISPPGLPRTVALLRGYAGLGSLPGTGLDGSPHRPASAVTPGPLAVRLPQPIRTVKPPGPAACVTSPSQPPLKPGSSSSSSPGSRRRSSPPARSIICPLTISAAYSLTRSSWRS
jgi:hypothetical protein